MKTYIIELTTLTGEHQFSTLAFSLKEAKEYARSLRDKNTKIKKVKYEKGSHRHRGIS